MSNIVNSLLLTQFFGIGHRVILLWDTGIYMDMVICLNVYTFLYMTFDL